MPPDLTSRIFELAPDRFLIFRPRDYHHSPHVHPHRYRFKVIKGLIEVRLGGRKMLARPERKVTLEPGLSCETRALEDSWLLVERTDRVVRNSALRARDDGRAPMNPEPRARGSRDS